MKEGVEHFLFLPFYFNIHAMLAIFKKTTKVIKISLNYETEASQSFSRLTLF